MTPTLEGQRVRLRAATAADESRLVAIRAMPEVLRWWRGEDHVRDFREALASETLHYLAIEDRAGLVVGGIQWEAESDPEYRHASIDLYLDPGHHRRGLGSDAVRTLARHLFDDVGHHRLTIDPAANNKPAIACYASVGFREVGRLREYERGADGLWHDGLLMELLARDFEGGR